MQTVMVFPSLTGMCRRCSPHLLRALPENCHWAHCCHAHQVWEIHALLARAISSRAMQPLLHTYGCDRAQDALRYLAGGAFPPPAPAECHAHAGFLGARGHLGRCQTSRKTLQCAVLGYPCCAGGCPSIMATSAG